MRLVVFVCLLSAALWAQQPQQNQQAQNQQSPQSLGTVRNDRSATMPQVGYSAQVQNQNQFIGCVSGSGNDMVLKQGHLGRTYHLKGDAGQLQSSLGKMVKVSGRLDMGNTPAIEVQQVQVVQDVCRYEGSAPHAIGGKEGNKGIETAVADTSDPDEVTPGIQSMLNTRPGPEGRANAKRRAEIAQQRPTAAQGADPNFEETMQNPDDAQRIASAAHQSELENSSAQLGVNSQPNYSNANNAQANSQEFSNQAQQNMGRASGSENVLQGGQSPAGQNAQPSQQGKASASGNANSSVITGCLVQSDQGGYAVKEQQTGTQFRVVGDASKLRDHVNHMVQVVGNKTGTYGPAVGTSGNTVQFHVQAIQDVAATCQQ